MNQLPEPRNEDPLPTIDAEIAELLDEYLTAREAGNATDRQQWLEQHPQHAERLAEYLDAAELFGGAETGGFDVPGRPAMPESIGDFEIIGELGRGGMGVVYEAREKSLDRIVALKVMRFGIVDPKALDRFRREAETAGALHHTNIVPVYATGREGDTSWYAMQRIEGESLATRLQRARDDQHLPELDEILRVGIQSAEALDHAHKRNVVHRDVKPANLILDGDERVWLTDFGLARRLVDAGATMTGAILGTPRYMSPEQADFRTTDVDHRSDVYSLGATLYEMSTGRPPFEGDDPLGLITQIREDDPPSVRSLRDDLPRDLDVVLQKAMEKDLSKRYQSAAEFAEDLRSIRDDHPIAARPLSILERAARLTRKHRVRFKVAAAAMAATACLIAALLYLSDQIHQSRLGAFRVRAGGGPYQATIVPAGETSMSAEAIHLTLPMQDYERIPTGDYEMLVAPQGQWSRRHRLPVTKGLPSDYRITGSEETITEIAIQDALVVTVADDESPVALWRQEGILKKVADTVDRCWQRNVSQVESVVTYLDESKTANAETESVDFANTRYSNNVDRGHHFLDDNPLLTQGVAALRTRIDLDGDGKGDTVVAATDRQALLALDHQGNTIWSRTFRFSALPSQSRVKAVFSRDQTLRFPGVFDLQDVGDQNADGIPDLFAMFVYYQISKPTEVCLATISGKTGAPIRFRTRSFTAKQNQFWPSDGIFFPKKNQYRNASGLSFSSDQANRSGYRNLGEFRFRHQPRSTPLRIAVPSPPLLIHDNEKLRVVRLCGDQCEVIDWEDDKGSPISFQLPFIPARAPKLARTDLEPLLIFHDHKQSQINTTSFSGTDVVAFDLQGTQRWTRSIQNVEWCDAIDRNHADWPLIADLNGDGIDEVILPKNRYLNGVEVGVRLLDSATGNPKWRRDAPYTSIRVSDQAIGRMTVTDDIDGDGWREIATACISGMVQPGTVRAVSEEEVFVYVDWISGKTGDSVSWARHRIPIIGDRVFVAQVDAIRSGMKEQPQGTVELDFVAGEQTLDSMLASAVVRFHPSSPDPTSIAEGLDRCATNKDDASNARFYRRRGGPFGIGGDDLVLISTKSFARSRLGESDPLAAWTDSTGRDLVALTGFDPPRLSVVDAASGHTIWSTDRADGSEVIWAPIKRNDGEVDFLLQKNWSDDDPPVLIDGNTGEAIVEFANGIGGRYDWSLVFPDDRSILVVSDGKSTDSLVTNPLAAPVRGLRMSLVSSVSGEIAWSRSFLFGGTRVNTTQQYGDLSLADFNGDGTLDVAGPHSHDGELFLAAWNGIDGEKLWETQIYQPAVNSNYWVPNVMVRIGGKPHMAYIGKPSKESQDRKLILCGPDGTLISTQDLESTSRLAEISKDYSYRYVALSDATQDGRPMIAIAREYSGRYRCDVFDLDQSRFALRTTFEDQQERSYLEGVWFRDLNDDGVRERVIVNRLVDESAQSDLSVTAFPMLESTPDFQVLIDDATSVNKVAWKSEFGTEVLWLRIDGGRNVAIDCSNGMKLAEIELENNGSADYAIIAGCIAEQTVVANPTLDGVEFLAIGESAGAPEIACHSHEDPRRVREAFYSFGGHLSLQQWGLLILRCGVALGVLVIVPLWYVERSIRDRRWSLSWMLLAPAIAGAWFVIWNSDWVWEPQLVINLLTGLAAWMCVGTLVLAIRGWTDERGFAIRLTLLVGTPFVFGMFMLVELDQRSNPLLRYAISGAGLTRVAFLSFAIVSQIYWIVRFPASASSWFPRLVRGQKAA